MATKKDQHVIPSGDKWGVRSTGSGKSSKVFQTKVEAVKHARGIAQDSRTGLYIHNKNGMVQSKNSYGESKGPPRGGTALTVSRSLDGKFVTTKKKG
jgi:hypothetical protein